MTHHYTTDGPKYAHNLVTVLGLQSIYGELETAVGLVKCDVFFKTDP